MVYTSNELVKKLGSFAKLTSSLKNGEYFRISHGIYSDTPGLAGELENLFVQYPNAVLTLQSAFAFYDMSDYIPEKYVIATPRNAHVIKNNKVEQTYITKELVNIGKCKVKTDFGFINIYDKERLLIELIRLRSKLSYAYYKELINSYREIVKNGQLNLSTLSDYCKLFKSGENIIKHIQEIVM